MTEAPPEPDDDPTAVDPDPVTDPEEGGAADVEPPDEEQQSPT